jgi:hypothetical protein
MTLPTSDTQHNTIPLITLRITKLSVMTLKRMTLGITIQKQTFVMKGGNFDL